MVPSISYCRGWRSSERALHVCHPWIELPQPRARSLPRIADVAPGPRIQHVPIRAITVSVRAPPLRCVLGSGSVVAPTTVPQSHRSIHRDSHPVEPDGPSNGFVSHPGETRCQLGSPQIITESETQGHARRHRHAPRHVDSRALCRRAGPPGRFRRSRWMQHLPLEQRLRRIWPRRIRSHQRNRHADGFPTRLEVLSVQIGQLLLSGSGQQVSANATMRNEFVGVEGITRSDVETATTRTERSNAASDEKCPPRSRETKRQSVLETQLLQEVAQTPFPPSYQA